MQMHKTPLSQNCPHSVRNLWGPRTAKARCWSLWIHTNAWGIVQGREEVCDFWFMRKSELPLAQCSGPRTCTESCVRRESAAQRTCRPRLRRWHGVLRPPPYQTWRGRARQNTNPYSPEKKLFSQEFFFRGVPLSCKRRLVEADLFRQLKNVFFLRTCERDTRKRKKQTNFV